MNSESEYVLSPYLEVIPGVIVTGIIDLFFCPFKSFLFLRESLSG